MKFINLQGAAFLQKMMEKKIVCFGVSRYINMFSQRLGGSEWMQNLSFFVDNNSALHGKEAVYYNRRWKICSPKCLINMKNAVVVIAVRNEQNILDIVRQLQEMKLSDNLECCALLLVDECTEYDNRALDLFHSAEYSINKIIHCCWFSGENKPEEYQKCIDSWKKYCPEFEIKEWNSDNYDIAKSKYMKQAYDKKKWAYVSDFARLDVVYQYGGIYFDMDVEILRNIDELLKYKGFFSFDQNGYIDLGSGFGAIGNLEILQKLLNVYDNIEFICEEGKMDFKKTIPQPARLLPIFEAWGYEKNNKLQIIDDIVILSPDYFKVIDDSTHMNRRFSGKEYGVHWHHAGWFDNEAYADREKRIHLQMEVKKSFSSD